VVKGSLPKSEQVSQSIELGDIVKCADLGLNIEFSLGKFDAILGHIGNHIFHDLRH